MVGRGVELLADLPVSIALGQQADCLDAFGCCSCRRGLRPVELIEQRPAQHMLLQFVVQPYMGQVVGVCCLFPAMAGGILQGVVDLVSNQPAGVCGECGAMPGLVRLHSLAQPNARSSSV